MKSTLGGCMQIIIVGCGKVGAVLTKELSREGHNVTVIDTKAKAVEQIVNEYDVMGYIGSGVSYEMQKEAGVEKADLLIAVTDSDELNLLCCLFAKKAGNCQTIARVRNPEYSQEVHYIKEELGLAMIINPDLAAASEMSRVLRLPSAMDVETFAKGKVEILKFRIKADSVLCDMMIQDIFTKLHSDILVCVVERGEEAHIPTGNFVLKEKDIISIAGAPQKVMEFFKKIGIKVKPVKDIMIVGGSRMAYYLAQMLLDTGVDVKILEKDEASCDLLCQKLPNVTIIHGDGSDKELLLEEGLDTVDAFAALTGSDEENIFMSLYAKSKARMKTITKVNKSTLTEVINSMDLDTVVYPKEVTTEYIVRYVRAMANSMGSNVESMHRLAGDKVEALSFIIRENAPVIDIPLMRLNLRPGILVAAILRGEKLIIPRGNDSMQVGDTVVIVTTIPGLQDIRDILKKK